MTAVSPSHASTVLFLLDSALAEAEGTAPTNPALDAAKLAYATSDHSRPAWLEYLAAADRARLAPNWV